MDPALQEQLLPELDPNQLVDAIIRLVKPDQFPPLIQVISRFGDVVTCRVRRSDIVTVYNHPFVFSMKAARLFAQESPHNTSANQFISRENSTEEYRAFPDRGTLPPNINGSGVVIGIIDWGCDFAHKDFIRNNRNSKVISLWDQSAKSVYPNSNRYGYGRIYSTAEINAAVATPNPYQTLGYHPGTGDPTGGAHGTHVMGVVCAGGASGTFGIAPEADIIFVHLGRTNSTENFDTGTMGDSVTILEALDFIHRTAGERPCVINLSGGTHGGPHDGTTLVERAFDNFMDAHSNRVICQSTGNYFSAKIHTSGAVKPDGKANFGVVVADHDHSTNEIEVWYSGKDKFGLKLSHPSLTVPIECELGTEKDVLLGGVVVARVYHRALEPNNGKNHIDIFLKTNAPFGTWEIELTGIKVSDGRYHSWIERDAQGIQARFPDNIVNQFNTTNSISNGYRSIITGSVNTTVVPHLLSRFSSSGPTIDGRKRPLLLAPGESIASSKSAALAETNGGQGTVVMSGTSMASPHVTGTVALMLQICSAKRPNVETIKRLLLSSCTAFNNRDDVYRSGYGVLNTFAAVQEAIQFRASALTEQFGDTESISRHFEKIKFEMGMTEEYENDCAS